MEEFDLLLNHLGEKFVRRRTKNREPSLGIRTAKAFGGVTTGRSMGSMATRK
ncbi:MAG: hypothetical protein AB2L24_17950 [Mangrovibacterium sp.]